MVDPYKLFSSSYAFKHIGYVCMPWHKAKLRSQLITRLKRKNGGGDLHCSKCPVEFHDKDTVHIHTTRSGTIKLYCPVCYEELWF